MVRKGNYKGGKKWRRCPGAGRKTEHNDEFHRVLRERQRKYDQEIAAIRRERKCSFKEAKRIRGDHRRKKKEKSDRCGEQDCEAGKSS